MAARPLALALAVLLAAVLAAMPGPARAQGAPALESAEAAILIDARDGTVMLARDADERRSIASTTKLMTALLALERTEPDEVIPAAPYDALPIESKINLQTGERLTVADLLEGLLLESANDAAATLAAGVSGSQEAFVEDMNERARQLGLDDTSYANPIGLDDPANYSTARDLAALARRLLRDREFARIVDLPSAVLESGSRERLVDNRNNLVAGYGFVTGVKTGHTRQAGYVLVGSARGRLGSEVISVVLGEPSEAARDASTLELLRYGLSRFRRVRALDADRALATVDIAYRDEDARLVPATGLRVVARRGERVRNRVEAPQEIEGELAAGERVGTVTVLRGGEVVRRVPLVTATKVPGAGLLRKVSSALGGAAILILVVVGLGAFAILGLNARSNRRRERERERRLARRREAVTETEPEAVPER